MEPVERKRIHAPGGKSISDLLSDIMILASFAVEKGRLPEAINISDLYHLWEKDAEKGQRLDCSEIDLLEFYYQLLNKELAPITAVSLRATEINDKSLEPNYMNSTAGKHVRKMWCMAIGILVLVIAVNAYQYAFDLFSGDWARGSLDGFTWLTLLYWLAGAITPFAYGAFGATVRMLRITETRLRDRSFDPKRLPEHRNRIVLGTLSGGIIVLLFSVGGVSDTSVKITEAGLGFIAGYSIDLVFSILDRLVHTLSPSSTQLQSNGKNHSFDQHIPLGSLQRNTVPQPVGIASREIDYGRGRNERTLTERATPSHAASPLSYDALNVAKFSKAD